jgi:glycerophosphoryl diester phosphodiesterase
MAFSSGNHPSTHPSPPRVIGHRGACGVLPEHTLASYQLAIDSGADAIEIDLVSTLDGHLIALHDLELSATTDVADRLDFASRRTRRLVDGKAVEGWFARDFALGEIKTLRTRQRLYFRDHSHDGRHPIPTLEEALELGVRSRSRGRPVQVYLELKHAGWHAGERLPLDLLLFEALRLRDLSPGDSGLCIEAFEPAVLRALRPRTDGRIVQLIESSEMISPAALAEMKTYADGIGVWKRLLIPTRDRAADEADESHLHLADPTSLIDDAHAIGLSVDAWTFRDESRFLAADYHANSRAEYEQFFAMGIDGVISDFPATAIAARQRR